MPSECPFSMSLAQPAAVGLGQNVTVVAVCAGVHHPERAAPAAGGAARAQGAEGVPHRQWPARPRRRPCPAGGPRCCGRRCCAAAAALRGRRQGAHGGEHARL